MKRGFRRLGPFVEDIFKEGAVNEFMSDMKMAKGQGKMETNENGVKRESNKNRGRFDLIPYEALEELAKWYEAGAIKYGDRNWEKGVDVQDCTNRMIRHAIKAGNGFMDEGPFAHYAAVIWNAIAAITAIKRNPYKNNHFRDEYLKELGLSNKEDTVSNTRCDWNIPSHDIPVYIHSRKDILIDKGKFSFDILDHQLVLNCDFENQEDLEAFQEKLAQIGLKKLIENDDLPDSSKPD